MPTTAELIRRGAAQHAARIAERWGDDAPSYHEVFANACRIGDALRDAGVGQGEHVALRVGNGPHSVSTGQTEAPLCMMVLKPTDHADGVLWSACGQPAVDADIRRVDEAGQVVEAEGIGEIQVRAPFAMPGYFDADE